MSLPPLESLHVTQDFLRELNNGNPNFKSPHPVPLLRFAYELCSSMVNGLLPVQQIKAGLDAVEFSESVSDDDLCSCLADVVAQMALDLTMPMESRSRLIKLARWLVEASLVPVRFFQERCEEEFLWECEMVKIKAQELKSKEVRVNTRLLYQQTKFNLLREESEGYAKLVTLLCEGSETFNSSSIIGTIKSLIGQFDLDPNRVFDIVLECFEMFPHNNVFLDLIPIFSKSHASQILGFKFQYYQRMEVQDLAPFGLYQLAALLVKQDFVDLDSIYAHLLPKDDEAFENSSTIYAKRLDEASKIGKINLAATGKELMDDDKQGEVTIDFFAALDMENQAVVDSSPELENSQTLGLLTGFLHVHDWYHANILFERLSPIIPVSHPQICSGLFRLIEKSICSAYDIVRKGQLQNCASSTNDNEAPKTSATLETPSVLLPRELFEILVCAGPYLYRDTLLLQKVCRVLKAYYLSALKLVSKGDGTSVYINGVNVVPRSHLKEAKLRVEEALGSCLLPSLQLIPANPAVAQEIWEVMSLLPYEVRYRLYGEWEKDNEKIPMILAARQTAKLDTRRILKRLAKENLKQLGRMVAKIAHANPLTVLRTIVHQIEAYRDMITPVVDAFKYLTQLEYDVLEYVVIERLAQSGREKLKDDGLNLSDWLQSLALFWGHLCKKYPSMELRGLFQYLVNQLKRGQGIELILLQELMQQMASVQYTENMTEEQLESMGGGETLRHLGTSFGVSRNNKALIKSTNRLRDSLLSKEEPVLAIPLLLLIAQHRSMIVINAEATYIKMVSEQFDRCHGVLLQYVDFLCSAVIPATAYAKLIPSLQDLFHLYHVDPEVAFLIYRPVMRLFKNQRRSVSWPSCDDEIAMGKDCSPHDVGNLVLDLNVQNPVRWVDLLGIVRTMLPLKAWNSLSPDLYATFWGLTLYDLHVPRNRYESEIAKQHAALKALEELSDNSSSAITKRKKDKEKIQELLDRLIIELQKHEEHVASVRRRLSSEKDRWLSSCPDTLKINMEFLQRCIFPRCTFSMPDAVYCAMFVHTLHSLGTPFFNTVNHIDVLICKTLHPMICCCTEYEAGRLGRFLFETLKIAYYWKSDESVYERECGNMPGFAVYYRYPNSQRVTYGQFIKVHWKWSQRITRLLIQCLESAEYMEIRNALIMLTKISSVFPVTRKSGINIEKRVAKIKSDEREDLKVLATGVGAALAARKPSWVTEEEFGMGYLDIKAASSSALKSSTGSGSGIGVSQHESIGGRVVFEGHSSDPGNSVKDQTFRTKLNNGRLERTEGSSGNMKLKNNSITSGSDVQAMGAQLSVARSLENHKHVDEASNRNVDENPGKATMKTSTESEVKVAAKRGSSGVGAKPLKQELKDEYKSAKASGRSIGASVSEIDDAIHPNESKHAPENGSSLTVSNSNTTILKDPAASTRMDAEYFEVHGEVATSKSFDLKGTLRDDDSETSDSSRPPHSRSGHSPRHDPTFKLSERQQRRASPSEEWDRLNKRRKGDIETRDMEGDTRLSDRDWMFERVLDKSYPADSEKPGAEELTSDRVSDKHFDRTKDKSSEKFDRDYKDRSDRIDKGRDDVSSDKLRDRSVERYGRERSVDRILERRADRSFDGVGDKFRDERNKDDRAKLRYNEMSSDKSHIDDRFHSQNLPPPPPLPPHVVPQSVNANRREDDLDRRYAGGRSAQRLSPRHDEKERRRSEENMLTAHDDSKRRREDEFRERKREDRDTFSIKAEEREREKEKEKARERVVKEEMDSNAASKRRKLKRDHIPGVESAEYASVSASSTISLGMSQPYDGRERGDRKGSMVQRPDFSEEPSMRMHVKEAASKIGRRDIDPVYDREWDDEKRQRAEVKRRHRK